MSSRTVYWLITQEKADEVVQSHWGAAGMWPETFLASGSIFSHGIVGISIEPDVCNFLGDPLPGNWWSLFMPLFPYHILLAGEGVGCIGPAGWY